MNPDAASAACTLCKRPMSAIEAGSGRLCSQCQSIVKNILPSNDGRLTTTPLRPEVAEAAAQLHAPAQQAPSPPKYDASRPESTQSNGGSLRTCHALG